MTQLTVSEETAANLLAKAAKNGCTPDTLLQSMLLQWESDEAFVNSMLTPELEQRMLADLKADPGTFIGSEEVDHMFEQLFRDLEAK